MKNFALGVIFALVCVAAGVALGMSYPSTPAESHTHVPFETWATDAPTMRFEDERALTQFVVDTNDDGAFFRLAFERDLHAHDPDFTCAHEFIDQRDFNGNGVVGQ